METKDKKSVKDEISMETILILAYTAWAIYSGYRVLTGRFEWLDRKAPLNVIVKIILSITTGYVIGAVYLMFLVFKLINIMFRF